MVDQSHVVNQYVSIPSYPSCEDCVSWSEGGVAVAGGENIHLYADQSLQSSSKNIANGKTHVLRVDQFDYTEWPDLPIATNHDTSFGEEQADCVVVALSWSPPGLGIHRRCVLSVLTSNLLLSIWENDGSQRGWRRTCILNRYVSADDGIDHSASNSKVNRKAQRIRASTWLPVYRHDTSDRWGSQLLLTADDYSNCTLWSIRKLEQNLYGSWEVTAICTSKLSERVSWEEVQSMTKLQASVLTSQRVRTFLTGIWRTLQDSNGQRDALDVSLSYDKLPASYSDNRLTVEVSLRGDQISGTITPIQQTRTSQDPWSGQTLQSNLSGTVPDIAMLFDWKNSTEWQEVLKQICVDYQEKFKLNRVRVRFWGSTLSPNGDRSATIVTLHPLDTYEYTTPVTEKSWLIVRNLKSTARGAVEPNNFSSRTRKKILQCLMDLISTVSPSGSVIDRKLLNVWSDWTSISEQYSDEHRFLRSKIQECDSATESVPLMSSSAQTLPLPSSPSGHELCEICDSPLLMDETQLHTKCESGHTYQRCGLTLIAIQEPRISKYCSDCDRQFLNVSKLGPLPHQSLVAALLNAFDVCPYCEGKYRS